jgi:hypothetical protein
MPLKNMGNGCYQWGDHGHKYCGPDAKKQAIKQGYAEGPDKFKKEMAQAIASLTSSDLAFIKRLEQEPVKADRDAFLKSVASTIESMDISLAYIPEHERENIPEEDFAGGHRSFPIRNQNDLDNAVHLIGHAPDPSKVKKKIMEIARRKGLQIPDGWK